MSKSKRKRRGRRGRGEPERRASAESVEGPPELSAPTPEPDDAATDAQLEAAVSAQAVATSPSRRSFFRQAWWALGSIAALEYLWLVVSFLRPRSAPEGEAGIVVAGPVSSFEPGTVTAFQRGKFYLSRLEDGGFLALSRECTHLGCTVPWDDEEGEFVCPCHASAYDARGAVINSPAPRPLDLFPIRIENDVVKVDTGEPRRRLVFAEEQVTLP